ncbi:MAG: serine hydrolase domain-containing protein, partial [Thermomicrobiales bacterium]
MAKHDPVLDVLAYAPRWLAYQRTYMPYVGAQVAVRRDGDLLFNEAYGYADLHKKVPLTVDHLFRIASHSKTFTGVACMQLVERGKLRLDDTAETYVEELQGAPMGGVTVRALLGHLSGMTRDGDDCGFWSLEFPFPDRTDLLQTI